MPKPQHPKAASVARPKTWSGDDVDFISGAEVAHLYTNNAQIKFNNWDATILFGEIMGETEEKLRVLPKARITMSLQFVKELAVLLNRSIESFETQVGKIQSVSLDVPPVEQ